MTVPRLELSSISKRFPGCLANDQVSLTLMPGEIHALLGENGAGKSTLVKIIYGVQQADSGTILWEGQPVVIKDPHAARRLGIGMVFQHFSLFDTLTVAENVALGLEQPPPMRELESKIRTVSERYGLTLDPARHIHTLSVGERQRVEIVRCLLQDPRLLIMDEPTSVLTPQEVDRLFGTLRRLAEEGCTILYISHKLEEIRALCSRATVLRGGRVVGACDPRRESARSMAEMMIGTTLTAPVRAAAVTGAAALEVRHLSTTSDDPFATNLKDVSLEVRAGEILGIAGVAGNGQAELLSALSGEIIIADEGSVRIKGQAAGHLDPRQRRALGLAFVPEERLGRGAVPELSLSENAILSGYVAEPLVRRGLVHFGRARGFAERIISGFNVVTHGHKAEARSLSGGNLQKFIIGREILQKPTLLVVGQPTWGVDAGAAAAIHQALIDLARGGAAVLVISQDLDELFVLSDRIAVLFHGHLSESRPTHHTTVEEIGLLMGGLFGAAPGEEDLPHGAA
ncbi:simple sugar transport system ATP-binding protein [Azospirillum fermentarium]|uniref:ABC transporter ATP-binding protein n=1 Tax=Azospirillum fermentarium TaxID=1233114 RepID=UPI002225CFF4|nr:ABC transporter ATP-binding protein [Azospirillum fermentarium]MCW2246786.1 simple sugar transport system ATP-binding protein [Azospirillum fermentarium]